GEVVPSALMPLKGITSEFNVGGNNLNSLLSPPAASSCMVNFSDPEGYIDSSDNPPLPDGLFLHCTYTVTVYTGYGVELQVKNVNLSDSEQLSIRGVDDQGATLVLANHTLLVEGQVIRSPTNSLSIYYRSASEGSMGLFQLHYQIFRLSCSLPKRPHFGEVSVLNLLPGGVANFHCHMGYHLQGEPQLTCINASLPVWSGKEPTCRALCGGTVKNATVGRVLSPSPHHGPNATLDRSCSWSLEAPKDQRLHLHLERLALGPTDRLVLWSGLDAGSVVLFDSGRGGQIPFEGVISEGPAVRVQFITDQPNHATGFNIRYEAFERGHCYEPYLQNGNFTTSDPLYGVGTVVQFTCDPGHSLEQGPPVIECISARDPYWNDTEPLCKAQCGGDLTGPGGVILSPNWPEWYGEGEDCSWRIHVGEDKRVLLDVQLLNISDSDMLTFMDGDEVTTRILGRYVGGSSPFKLSSSTPDLTVTFHSDPAGLVFGKGEGFIINYIGERLATVRPGPRSDEGRTFTILIHCKHFSFMCLLRHADLFSTDIKKTKFCYCCVYIKYEMKLKITRELSLFLPYKLISLPCRYHTNLRLPLIYPHPYRQITVETEFDNPLYETGGDSREYEVSI
uniref:Seizure related 6 homolog like n=1 Tax=Poecilia reticulata TaxID=8081 RepID=A0A3P9PH50_POERE